MPSDNGVPFTSPDGLFNLRKLAVWWLRLGISTEGIRPGHQRSGRFLDLYRVKVELYAC